MCPPSPQYQSTKILLEVPPYFPHFEIYLGLLQYRMGCQSPPYLSPCACRCAWGGLGPSEPCGQNFTRGSPLFPESKNSLGPLLCLPVPQSLP